MSGLPLAFSIQTLKETEELTVGEAGETDGEGALVTVLGDLKDKFDSDVYLIGDSADQLRL